MMPCRCLDASSPSWQICSSGLSRKWAIVGTSVRVGRCITDVAHVRDGYQVQTNIVRVNGKRSSLLTVLRNGKASTLDIIQDAKNALPRILELRKFIDVVYGSADIPVVLVAK